MWRLLSFVKDFYHLHGFIHLDFNESLVWKLILGKVNTMFLCIFKGNMFIHLRELVTLFFPTYKTVWHRETENIFSVNNNTSWGVLNPMDEVIIYRWMTLGNKLPFWNICWSCMGLLKLDSVFLMLGPLWLLLFCVTLSLQGWTFWAWPFDHDTSSSFACTSSFFIECHLCPRPSSRGLTYDSCPKVLFWG